MQSEIQGRGTVVLGFSKQLLISWGPRKKSKDHRSCPAFNPHNSHQRISCWSDLWSPGFPEQPIRFPVPWATELLVRPAALRAGHDCASAAAPCFHWESYLCSGRAASQAETYNCLLSFPPNLRISD